MSEISVIVPVYKVEKYLKRCVDSILSQTFTGFEIVLVDDGSPDGCPALCDGLAENDGRIKVIHKKNGGLSSARNAGIDYVLKNSSSEWITFIDSDDWVHPDMFGLLHGAVKEHGVKVAACGVMPCEGETEFPGFDGVFEKLPAETYYMGKSYTMIACAKLYHISCFKKIRYPVGKMHEDEFITHRIIYLNSECANTDFPLYYYFQNPASLVGSNWTPKRLDAFEAFESQISFFKKHRFLYSYGQAAETYAYLIHKTYVTIKNEYPRYSRYLKYVRRKMKWLLKKHGKNMNVSPDSHPHYYEMLAPERVSE